MWKWYTHTRLYWGKAGLVASSILAVNVDMSQVMISLLIASYLQLDINSSCETQLISYCVDFFNTLCFLIC